MYFRYFDVEYRVHWVDTACYSLFRERDIKKNDATCIEFAIKAAESREKRPSHPCTNLLLCVELSNKSSN